MAFIAFIGAMAGEVMKANARRDLISAQEAYLNMQWYEQFEDHRYSWVCIVLYHAALVVEL
jgi:hypothetical protein